MGPPGRHTCEECGSTTGVITDLEGYRLKIKRGFPVKYPTIHIFDAELFYYPTKEAAEEMIRGFGWEPDLYCFIIEACPYNRDVSDRAYRRWVYD